METCQKTHMTSQIFSGRWLLTIAAAACLGMITVADCLLALKGKKTFVDPAAILAVITMVFMAYFNKPTAGEAKPPVLNGDRHGNGNGGSDDAELMLAKKPPVPPTT